MNNVIKVALTNQFIRMVVCGEIKPTEADIVKTLIRIDNLPVSLKDIEEIMAGVKAEVVLDEAA